MSEQDLPVKRLPEERQAMGDCGGCEETELLAWRDESLGMICRSCAALFIRLEMERRFPKAKRGGRK